MQMLPAFIFVTTFVTCIIYAGFCYGDPIRPIYERNENMLRPTRPKIFSSPNDFKSYLEDLGNFYAIAGRPRFGKRTLSPGAANYLRDDSSTYKNLPVSYTDLLQMLSSMTQNQE
ncbi:conserved hypothetical protein [Pediculus humanus corporis]|uniref:Neuropeptide Y n=1 Tax=Pediculus humanus subsp. corporis TaxID=121224 RepID=E0VQ91_PEDHC|nr:uncharacterized protein Phum_PHUM374160 [Pediculus humanus corporis]AFW19650.1 neuropeptide Y [Pediculus humanus corporis]EEB15547.1 conserved hypothetical protein [Pediculus humanus corporis]